MTVSVPKAAFRDFFTKDITAVLTTMKQASKGQPFLPSEISESIVMPQDEFMVTFRNSTKCKHIPLPSWFTPDIP